SLQCALGDLLLVAISPTHSLGMFGAQCFGLLYCVAVPAVYLTEFHAMSERLIRQVNTFRDEAMHDALTGVGNRRSYDITLASRIARIVGGDLGSLAIFVVDIDDFKLFNDEYGHSEGDICLARVAKGIQSALVRMDDAVFRYGGEEFVVLI